MHLDTLGTTEAELHQQLQMPRRRQSGARPTLQPSKVTRSRASFPKLARCSGGCFGAWEEAVVRVAWDSLSRALHILTVHQTSMHGTFQRRIKHRCHWWACICQYQNTLAFLRADVRCQRHHTSPQLPPPPFPAHWYSARSASYKCRNLDRVRVLDRESRHQIQWRLCRPRVHAERALGSTNAVY